MHRGIRGINGHMGAASKRQQQGQEVRASAVAAAVMLINKNL